MDTLRDKVLLESLWQKENPPWKVWESEKQIGRPEAKIPVIKGKTAEASTGVG
jgi:hypothetical protein